MTPEARARERIDAVLKDCGWEVQDYKQFNPSAARGIALREVPLKLGICDYLTLVDQKAVDCIEAKKRADCWAALPKNRVIMAALASNRMIWITLHSSRGPD